MALTLQEQVPLGGTGQVDHPDGQTIGLFLGEAEDGGSDLCWARADRGGSACAMA